MGQGDTHHNQEGRLEKLSRVTKNLARSYVQDFKTKEYWVDTVTAQAFWAPLMTLNEVYLNQVIYNNGSSWKETGLARIIGLVTGMAVDRRLSIVRDYWASQIFNVNSQSTKKRKDIADISLALLAIPPLYAINLAAAGMDVQEVIQNVPRGAGIQIGLMYAYLKVLGKSRALCNTTPEYLREHKQTEVQ